MSETTNQIFEKLPPPIDAKNHAVYGGSLLGPGLIERFDAYGNPARKLRLLDVVEDKEERQVVFFDCQVGSRLTGHKGIVHGGIVSLLFDEACGWGYEGVVGQEHNISAVTGNLSVTYRQPLRAGERCHLRVYHERTEGRKVTFRASLSSGGVVYADATCLYIMLKRSRL